MTQRRFRPAHLLGAVACALAITTTTGCHVSNPYKPTEPGQASQAAASLTALPTLEDTKAQLTGAIEQIGQQISALAPGVSFAWRHEESRVGCRPPYEQSEGQVIMLPSYVSDMPIPEQNWKQAYDITAAAAKILGATTVTMCPARSRNSRWSRIDTWAPPRESRC